MGNYYCVIMRVLLFPFSLIYFLILQIIYFLYRIKVLKKFRPPCAVISVGNITMGGTGKTPLVELLAKYFWDKGKKVTVLIRGYGRDESFILKKRLDNIVVLVGRDRVKNAQMALKHFDAQIIILDDAFQHWRIERDLDILVIDSTKPFGNGFLLPAGILREPVSALKRSDIFFLTRTDQVSKGNFKEAIDRLEKIRPDTLIVESIHRPLFFYKLKYPEERIFLEALKQKKAVLISSIGNPDAFEKTIGTLGIRVEKHFKFCDHFWYKDKNIQRIFDYCRSKAISIIITTEKDAVKLGQGSRVKGQGSEVEVFVLVIKIEITKNEEGLLDRLNRICNC